MSDTANAREIIEDWLLSSGSGNSAADLIAVLKVAGLEIRPIAPPAGKEAVDEAARAFYRKVWERAIEPPPAWELLPEDNADKVFCREYAVHVLAAIRVPLIQRGLREAAEMARESAKLLRDHINAKTPSAVVLDELAVQIEARIDAMGKGEE